jgi:tetratricopeptide (TPR) repeat protein
MYDTAFIRPASGSDAMLCHAMAALDRACQLTPRDACLYHNRGRLAWCRGDHPKALADLSHAVDLDPGCALYRLSLAALLRRLDRRDQADAQIVRALSLSPSLVASRYWQERVAPRPDHARHLLQQALKQLPRDQGGPILASRRARLLLALEDTAAAGDVWGRALEQVVNLNRPHLYLGRIARHRGDLQQAEAHLRRSAFLDPWDPLPALELGRLYDFRQQTARAVDHYLKALVNATWTGSEHARRSPGLYASVRSPDHGPQDDIIPAGWLRYCRPEMDTRDIRQRCVTLLNSMGREARATRLASLDPDNRTDLVRFQGEKR